MLNQTLNHTFSYFEPTINLTAVYKVAPEKKKSRRKKRVAPEKKVAPEEKSRARKKKSRQKKKIAPQEKSRNRKKSLASKEKVARASKIKVTPEKKSRAKGKKVIAIKKKRYIPNMKLYARVYGTNRALYKLHVAESSDE